MQSVEKINEMRITNYREPQAFELRHVKRGESETVEIPVPAALPGAGIAPPAVPPADTKREALPVAVLPLLPAPAPLDAGPADEACGANEDSAIEPAAPTDLKSDPGNDPGTTESERATPVE